MNTFNKTYFIKRYRSAEDKSSPQKLASYRAVIRRLKPNPSLRRQLSLLDIGCGYGKFLSLVKDDYQTVGIDPSDYVINSAKKTNQKTTFFVSPLLSYNLDKRFDIVTAFDVLEHTADPKKALKKIKSLLTPDGLFICVVPVYDRFLGKIGGLLDKDQTHLQKLSRQEWLKLIGEKFIILETQGMVRYSFPLVHMYVHIMHPFLKDSGQAIMVAARK